MHKFPQFEKLHITYDCLEASKSVGLSSYSSNNDTDGEVMNGFYKYLSGIPLVTIECTKFSMDIDVLVDFLKKRNNITQLKFAINHNNMNYSDLCINQDENTITLTYKPFGSREAMSHSNFI
jgi:hypothetical protein